MAARTPALKGRRPGAPFSVEALWQIERLGHPSLSPDGTRAVVSLTRYSMDENRAIASLWLLSTRGDAPRPLTHCGDKDGEPAWSPRGDLIAFTAQREQEGHKDESAQIYLIAPDGGEARRAAHVATGVEALRWCPDGRRLLVVSWVWPGLHGSAMQARQVAASRRRKESGYVSSETVYRFWDANLPMGRVPHLLLLDTRSGKLRDLFEGTPYELSRAEPNAGCFDVSPDGKRVVFACDLAAEKRLDNRYALVEMELATRRSSVIVQDPGWDCQCPRYSPDGQRVAFIASHQGRRHTMPTQLAVWQRPAGKGPGRWQVVSSDWDHAVQGPLRWLADGSAVLFCAESRGRNPLWQFDLATRQAQVRVEGGWVQGFDLAGDTLVSVADAAQHPGRAHAHRDGAAPLRLESFNDALLARHDLGRVEELWFEGAQGEPVQLWLTYPPQFNPRRKHPLLHVIHGGPHTAMGDAWHYRWNALVMAAQGMVVVAVNYHGSSGFGFGFLDSITQRFGELELQDLEAATEHLLARPWVDAQRVYAAGGSYGGYLAAWMNARATPGRYAAYVCHAGCFDWVGMMADDAYTWFPKELGATSWDNMAKVHSQSPHAFAATMSTPTLVIHGALDYRVPDAQGLAYYNTLKLRGIDARLLWFPDENHWVLKPRNSRQWHHEFFAWLRRYKT